MRSVNWLQNVGIEVMKNPRQGFVVGGKFLRLAARFNGVMYFA